MLSNKDIFNKQVEKLKNLSGLDITIHTNEEDIENTIKSLSSLIEILNIKKSKTTLLKELMLGKISVADINKYIQNFNFDNRFCLFTLYFQNKVDEIIYNLLKEFFSNTGDYIINMSQDIFCIFHPYKNDDIVALSHNIVDFINTEAMSNVKLIYSDINNNIYNIKRIYDDNILALNIANIFYTNQYIFSSQKLGIAGLLYELPRHACLRFLNEFSTKDKNSTINMENIHTIDVFINNNLNISETARSLHMHRNTLVYRIEQLENKTGLNLRTFEGAMTFRLLKLIKNFLNSKEKNQYE